MLCLVVGLHDYFKAWIYKNAMILFYSKKVYREQKKKMKREKKSHKNSRYGTCRNNEYVNLFFSCAKIPEVRSPPVFIG